MSIVGPAEPLREMATVGAMVSKRSVRSYMEDGEEHKGDECQSKRNSKSEEQFMAEMMERRGSTSSSKMGSEVFSSTSSTTTAAALSDGASTESWADPKEPLSWGQDGKLLPLGLAKDAYFGDLEAPDVGMQMASLPITGKPTNFGIVVPGVYRCGYPQAEDYTFVQGLNLKTVVTLVNKDLPDGYKTFLDANNIKHRVFDMKGTKKQDIPVKTMKAILRLVLDRENHPMLIHCNHGKHRTGCVVGVVRKVTGWQLSPILDEYRSFASPKERECDINYITAFQLSNISPLFARKSLLALQTSGFTRAALFTVVVLLIWLISGSRLAWHQRSRFVEFR